MEGEGGLVPPGQSSAARGFKNGYIYSAYKRGASPPVIGTLGDINGTYSRSY